jgi:hypothetical protein
LKALNEFLNPDAKRLAPQFSTCVRHNSKLKDEVV